MEPCELLIAILNVDSPNQQNVDKDDSNFYHFSWCPNTLKNNSQYVISKNLLKCVQNYEKGNTQ